MSQPSNPTSPPPNLSNILPKLIPRRRPPRPEATNQQPIPATPPLPAPLFSSEDDIKQHSFIPPKPRIISRKDLDLFLTSPTYTLLVSFVFHLTESVQDLGISKVVLDSDTDNTIQEEEGDENVEPSHTIGEENPKNQKKEQSKDGNDNIIINKILKVLNQVEQIVSECPADNSTGSRFGNVAFRNFLDTLDDRVTGWHRELGIPEEAIQEIKIYFSHCWGNRKRIDYGSGHELNFVVWLLCLYQLNFITPSHFPLLVLHLFPRYLDLTRLLQSTYYLEPAGSHGVWGLDDYVFLPFLFGSSQLIHHPFIRPMSIHNTLILEEYSHDYLYLNQVSFINSVKNIEGLRWHSPMLDDISAAKNWEKIQGGMRRMFVIEVLGKLPVMQHFLFGSLVQGMEGMNGSGEDGREVGEGKESGEMGGHTHTHDGKGWDDCCGIKVPSSIAAASEEMKKKRMGGGEGGVGGILRRIPFD